MSLLKDKIAVVTGGSSGIGLATAERFADQGAYVFIAGRRQAELDIAVAQIGRNVTGVKTDISNLDDLDRLYETVAKRGKIDVLFAGAAFVEKMMTPEATPELQRACHVRMSHLLGHSHCLRRRNKFSGGGRHAFKIRPW